MQVSDFLNSLKDPSEQIQALVDGLLEFTRKDCLQNVAATGTAIAKCDEKNAKRLEVELRLIQIALHLFGQCIGATSGLEIKQSCEKVMQLCQQYPDTAGKFVGSLRNLERSLQDPRSLGQLYRLSSDKSEIWDQWREHQVGHLARCQHGHPFSTVTFDGCPECGREVKLTPAKTAEKNGARAEIDYESFLKNDEFLASMQGVL